MVKTKIKMQEIMKITCPNCGHNTISQVIFTGDSWRNFKQGTWRMFCDFCNGWLDVSKEFRKRMKYKD
jgi:RNase P subunit RPR2